MLKHLNKMPTDKVLRLRAAASKVYDAFPSYTQAAMRAGEIIGWANNVLMQRSMDRLTITPTPEHLKRPPTPWFQYEPKPGCRWYHPDTAQNGEETELGGHTTRGRTIASRSHPLHGPHTGQLSDNLTGPPISGGPPLNTRKIPQCTKKI